MKTKTFSILFALVMILSVSVGVFAQDFEQTWDEETVLTVFSDMNLLFPDMFENEDSDFIWVESDDPYIPNFKVKKDIDLSETADFESKAAIDPSTATLKADFDPCGDGLIAFDMTVTRLANTPSNVSGLNSQYYGPDKIAYLRQITARVNGVKYPVTKVSCSGGEGCPEISFRRTSSGNYEAHIKGYIQYNDILLKPGTIDPSTTLPVAKPNVEISIVHSTYKTAFWPVELEYAVSANAQADDTKNNYCQAKLEEYNPKDPTMPSVRAVYDENTGEARFQVTIRNYKSTAKDNYVIPADVLLKGVGSNTRYTNYTCKYTVYNNANGAPRTDYCKYGQGIGLGKNAVIRFDITIDHISSAVLRNHGGEDIDFEFRVGGMTRKIKGVFKPVDFPCPIVSRLKVKDPLYPFLGYTIDIWDADFDGSTTDKIRFYGEGDKTINPSGAYGIYKNGVWGMYQKCGKYAYMAVRLFNDGLKDEVINLKNVAVAINGGTPMSWNWVLTTVDAYKNKVTLAPGEEVILIGRAKVTDYPSQMNSDVAMTGAINFLDYGFYITGSVFSDHNNTNCVAAPK